MGKLSLADRATIANMSPEYGATMGFFPVDSVTLDYLRLTGRDEEKVLSLVQPPWCVFSNRHASFGVLWSAIHSKYMRIKLRWE